MKTRSARTKSAPSSSNGIAYASIIGAFISIGLTAYFFYVLVTLFVTFDIGNITPYVTYVSLLIMAFFFSILLLYLFNRYRKK